MTCKVVTREIKQRVGVETNSDGVAIKDKNGDFVHVVKSTSIRYCETHNTQLNPHTWNSNMCVEGRLEALEARMRNVAQAN